MAWIYCRAASTAWPALVGADRWSALRLAQPSTHGADLLPSGFYCPACFGGCRPWSALRLAQPSTHGVDLLPSGFYCPACFGGCRPLVGTEAGPAIHAWRGSTAEPAAGCSPAPGGAVSVVLTADGRSLPSVPSWLGPLPFRGGWPDAVRSFGPVASTHGVDLLPTLVGSNVCRPRTAPTGAACPRRDLPAGTGRHCWRHSRCWQCCHAPAD